MTWAERLESLAVPDALVRWGIRRLLAARLRSERERARHGAKAAWIEELRRSPIAPLADSANAQHYMLPPQLFERVLGPRMKYSGCLWPEGVDTLEGAEEAMLALTAERAGLRDGQDVLDLGCGWGAFTLWAAQRFPTSRFLAVSNSGAQRDWIMRCAAERGLPNVEVVTADVASWAPDRRFDRVVSIEMLEHVRNYEALFARIAGWLRPEGRLFAHVFCHREHAYPFETDGATNWMGRHFFTGGQMPSADLLPAFSRDLELEQQWRVGGEHYARTAEAWLVRLDDSRDHLLPILASTYGEGRENLWLRRWRIFYLCCAELFASGGGDEWQVAHYTFRPRTVRP